MNPLGCHALVWAGDWSEASARYAIESTARVGFDLIEIAILDPENVDTAMTKSLLADNGLGAACSLGLDDSTDVSSEDPAVVARGQDRLGRRSRRRAPHRRYSPGGSPLLQARQVRRADHLDRPHARGGIDVVARQASRRMPASRCPWKS